MKCDSVLFNGRLHKVHRALKDALMVPMVTKVDSTSKGPRSELKKQREIETT